MSKSQKEQSNPYSTGGGGGNFESRVQAAFTVLMLTGRIVPCLPSWHVSKLKLQGRYEGFNTDDFIVYAEDPKTHREAKLLAQIKHSISISEGNEIFKDVIQAAWNDFNNKDIFKEETDVIALITGPLSALDINNTRIILEWARHALDEKEFLHKVNLSKFSNETKKSKLKVFQTNLRKANDGVKVSDEETWRFLKSFHLIGYDLDTEAGSTFSLLQSLLSQNTTGNPVNLWSRIVDYIQTSNQNAGTITLGNIPHDILEHFKIKQNPNWVNDIGKLRDHSDYIIKGIKSDIGGIHVKRQYYLEEILEASEKNEFVFLLGERGCGKSSLVREFAQLIKDHVPYFFLRTEDLDKSHLDNVFSVMGLNSSLRELEAGFALAPKKYLLIESLEKLLELQNTAAFNDLMQFVQRNSGWTIIASGREYAYQQISFNFIKPSGVKSTSIFIKDFNKEEIKYLGGKFPILHSFISNKSISNLIKNPFFASLAYKVAELGTDFSKGGERELRTIIWRDIISKEHVRNGGMPIKRRKMFIDIAVERAKKMTFAIQANKFDSAVLQKLEEDNLIMLNVSNNTVSLAHDILEDWALEQHIEERYQTNDDIYEFLNDVGHEPAMNRAYRLWLHQKIRLDEDVTNLILFILKDKKIERFWQDETISAVLLGENAFEIINKLNEQLFENNNELLKRFCFMLRTACKAPDNDQVDLYKESNFLLLKPYGHGWAAIINFLYKNKKRISKFFLPHITEVLLEWSALIHIDKELPDNSREAGLLALSLLNIVKNSYRDEEQKKLLKVIIKTVSVIKNEFNKLVESEILTVENEEERLPYVSELCSMSLTGIEGAFLCKYVPEIVVRIAKNEWLINDSIHKKQRYLSANRDIEESFGLNDHVSDSFFPPSGAKGPFQQLLRFHPIKGLNFILMLLNTTSEKYAKSVAESESRSSYYTNNREIKIIKINLNNERIEQYSSENLWTAYRGYSVVPYLLQSSLMALENWLIDIAEFPQYEDRLEWIFNYILKNSNSVMPTAVLVSLATGYPNKFVKVIYPLLETPDLYFLDQTRLVSERSGSGFNIHNSILNRDVLSKYYSQEREKADTHPWRKKHLEDLIIELQFSPFRDKAIKAIESLHSKVPKNEEWGFRFNKIDTRGWKSEINEENQTVIMSPGELEPNLADLKRQTHLRYEFDNRFYALYLWAEKTYKDGSFNQDYFKSWEEVYIEIKTLYELIENENTPEIPSISRGSIVKAATILLKEYPSFFKREEGAFCSEIVVKQIITSSNETNKLLKGEFDKEGTILAASILPILLDYVEDMEDVLRVKKIIVIALTHPDYNVRKATANGIRKYLWSRDSRFANLCLKISIEFAKLQMENNKVKYESQNITNVNDELIIKFREKTFPILELKYNITDITFESYSSSDLLNACLIIPNGSIEKNHIAIFFQLMRLISEDEKNSNDYSLRKKKKLYINHEFPLEFSNRFADYLIKLPIEHNQIFREQLILGCDSSPQFISWLLLSIAVSTEKVDNKIIFWNFWNQLSDKVQEIALSIKDQKENKHRDKRNKLVGEMLFLDVPWQKTDYEKQDIGIGKEFILEFVSKAGENSDVFEAMASLMYHFPRIFLEQGLILLANHQNVIKGTKLFSKVNTIYYLEISIQRFLLQEYTEYLSLKQHKSCHILLDALIETASSKAYFLREHLIKSRRILSRN
jgi:energy-coupling factor transporter ATP-binding protein EcfA2